MCEHKFETEVCAKCGEYVTTYTNYNSPQNVRLPYRQYVALRTIEAILSRLSCPEYTTQVFEMYRSMKFKGRTENILKIKSIIYKVLRNKIGLVHIATDRREGRRILRNVMLNFKREYQHSAKDARHTEATAIVRSKEYVDGHLDLVVDQELKDGKRGLKKTKELELLHKLYQK